MDPSTVALGRTPSKLPHTHTPAGKSLLINFFRFCAAIFFVRRLSSQLLLARPGETFHQGHTKKGGNSLIRVGLGDDEPSRAAAATIPQLSSVER